MAELPEERQAQALRNLIEIAERRAELRRQLDQLTEPLREASLTASETGVAASRIIGIAGISPKTFYGWKAEAESGKASKPRRRRK